MVGVGEASSYEATIRRRWKSSGLRPLSFGAATAAICLVAVVYLHSRNSRLESERNLAGWQQLADESDEADQIQ